MGARARQTSRARAARVTRDRTVCVSAPLSLGTSEPREIPIPTDGPWQKFPFTSGLATPGSLTMREQGPADRHTHQRTVAGASVVSRGRCTPLANAAAVEIIPAI